MKKPEPCQVAELRGSVDGLFGLVLSGLPKRRRRRSIGVCFEDDELPPSISRALAPNLTITEMTAGFTLSTTSAKPAGGAVCAWAAEITLASSTRPGPPTTIVAPSAAIATSKAPRA